MADWALSVRSGAILSGCFVAPGTGQQVGRPGVLPCRCLYEANAAYAADGVPVAFPTVQLTCVVDDVQGLVHGPSEHAVSKLATEASQYLVDVMLNVCGLPVSVPKLCVISSSPALGLRIALRSKLLRKAVSKGGRNLGMDYVLGPAAFR